MIAFDANILVYAHRRESRHHHVAVDALRASAGARAAWAIPWPCLFEFFSVVTNPRIWKEAASSADQAWRQILAWTSSPSVLLLAESRDFLVVLETFLLRPRVRGPIVHDARVAALCVAHGVTELLTADRDFALFPELRTRNPLQSSRSPR
jgi:hypothetical protein